MSRIRQFFDHWQSDYDLKTLTASSGSLVMTVVFALYNAFLGAYHSSLWYGTVSAYYLIMSVLRGYIVLSDKRIARRGRGEQARKKAYLISSVLLLILNVSMAVPVSLLVMRQKPVNMTLIPAIAMAAYTTYKIVMASDNLKRLKRSDNSLVRLLRTIGFADALMSILTLQNTLIMVNMKEESTEMLTLSAITSAAIMLTVLALSVAALRKGIVSLKRKK